MIKALFFDIDGTLVSFKTHTVPDSTINAIKKASQAGVKIFISTGRPFQLINNLTQISHLIDGYITTNGAYSFVGGSVVNSVPIPKDEVGRFVDYADKYDFACIIVGRERIAIYNEKPIVDKVFRKMLNVDFPFTTGLLRDDEDVFQITPFIDDALEEKVMADMPGSFSARWYHAFTDVTAAGIDKGSALVKMAQYHGLKIEETMAFGDGGNDIPIIKKAGVGIAMGNAGDELKGCADYVTASVDEDGIENALIHFNVIER